VRGRRLGERDRLRTRSDPVRTHCANTLESGSCLGAIHVTNCDGLAFHHLGARARTGAFWIGGGEATWSDVDIVAGHVEGQTCAGGAVQGWYDIAGSGGQSVHFFFGSRIMALGDTNALANIAVNALDAGLWFYGGDILARPEPGFTTNVNRGVRAAGGDIRVFGASVRSVGAASGNKPVEGVFIESGGVFHMHSGIIRAASTSQGNVDVVGLTAKGPGSVAHTPGTAFVIVPSGSGSANRLRATNGGTIQSPFVWPAGSVPPAAGSLHGMDVFVDTDAGGEGEAHLMVRDDTCASGGGPWRDMATGSCRP
jgi:hypothetical protein